MSGSGGGFTPRYSKKIECSDLVFEAQLSSPEDGVDEILKVGDILSIVLIFRDLETIVSVFLDELLVGGIVCSYTSQLIECLEKGFTYSAEVLSVNGGQVKIRVFSDVAA